MTNRSRPGLCAARRAATRGAASADPPVSVGQAVEAVTRGLPVTVGTTAALGGAVVRAGVVVRVGVGAAVVGATVVGATMGVGVARTVSGAHASPAIRAIENSAGSTRALVTDS
jgi:hypothetical protein